MAEDKGPKGSGTDSAPATNQISAPTISLPKGGGAIRGIGEKFAANPVTGTGSMSVPIATSPGRGGFGPQLSLSYDSGAGNGPFGLGWNLSLPSITRKTDKGLPKYQDAEESDVFILSGAEDLVPEFEKDAAGNWIVKDGKHVIHDKPRTVDGVEYRVRRYRPRIEGLFARIERWTDANGVSHWRSISKDNITTLYGNTDESCIVDPADKAGARIFSWLICESYDDKGNAIRYEYKKENSQGIDRSSANEANRQDTLRTATRYLKRIKYGNKTPRQAGENLSARQDWMFEAVFDYGEHYVEDAGGEVQTVDCADNLPQPNPREWKLRLDPFSSYRAGFEVRTYRLCQRVLMFHHFDELKDIDYPGGENYLVRATHFAYNETTVASFITRVTQSGYKRIAGQYRKKSLPPVEFTYSQAVIQEEVREVDPASLKNLPQGLDNSRYQWADLDGEGLSGILTEQGGAWFYKRNQSAVPVKDPAGKETTVARFAPLELVATMPSSANLSGGQQLLDLAGDGQLDVVDFEGPAPGFFERTMDEEWDTHRPFTSLPNIAWRDPNLKFIDLTGDGHADILITEDEAFSWYPSLAEAGFGPAENVRQAIDEELGPRLVFADGTQSIYLADMSGDGLTDLVRIRNGEVCYWPNLGYGRFGAKVTMDKAPWFDASDMFDQRRIRLADIDGSGLVDILYLTGHGVQLYFNQSGNAWSERRILSTFPRIDNLSAVSTVDLLGNGTACLVWSSPLPGDARSTIRYIDLMGGQKPYLLTKTVNNLGGETEVTYAPSTKFYLQDKQAGTPWITKLPFPVHCVEKVTARDKWRQTEFASTYSYHHGYFDGIEHEFRGFGRVEQRDVETYGKFMQGNIASPYITDQHDLYQPPIKTITWFHTGAALDRQCILTQFQAEYFPNSLAAMPGYSALMVGFNEKLLPEPDLESQDLSAEEWREALRACKGMTLRQEIYELDVNELERSGEQIPVRLFSATTHNCHIRRIQPKGDNQHAAFLVTESEALSYHYELDLRSVTFPAEPDAIQPLEPDPRLAHTLNLSFDEYGNVQQSIAVGYKRVRQLDDPDLAAHAALIREAQRELHLAYSETHYTEDAIDPATGTAAVQYYRLRVPCEVQTYELTGITPKHGIYFDLTELRSYHLSDTLPNQGSTLVARKLYHEVPQDTLATKRLVEHARTLFFDDNATGPNAATRFLKMPLPLCKLGKLGLPYEQYKLSLTDALLNAVFTDGQLAVTVPLAMNLPAGGTVRDALTNWKISGYLSGADATALFGLSAAGEYWMRSGVAGFKPDAAQHFYLPEQYTDPFNNITTLQFDKYDLFSRSSSDALGNTVAIPQRPRINAAGNQVITDQFDYRVLAPLELVDPNGNYSAVAFDIVGMPTASAVMGKLGTESGDNLTALQLDVPAGELESFLTKAYDKSKPATWLGNATARYVYDFGMRVANDGTITYADRPASACGIVRETHVRAGATEIQVGVEYSDGLGAVLVKKSQAEPDPDSTAPNKRLRWIASGKTVLNNKGKPVKQYEPYFSLTEHRFDATEAENAVGVTPIMYYDSAGRLIRTESADGSYSRVEFSPWRTTMFDANDTVDEANNAWYEQHTGATATAEERRAAALARAHRDTPSVTILDSLGRKVIAVTHNRIEDANGAYRVDGKRFREERYVTYSRLDAEGKPLWLRDARGNLVMQHLWPTKPDRDEPRVPRDFSTNGRPNNDIGDRTPTYDIAGNPLFRRSMDSGMRWMLNDASGKPMFAWDVNERQAPDDSFVIEQRLYFTEYDALHRPTATWLRVDGAAAVNVERSEYRDTRKADGSANPQLAGDQAVNLVNQVVQQYDASGLIQTVRRDFKGNVLELRRQLNNHPTESLIDWQGDLVAKLDPEAFRQLVEYDALNRVTLQYNWHRDALGKPVAKYEPSYNERGLLASEKLTTRLETGAAGIVAVANAVETEVVREIRYDAKGQKTCLVLGNGTITQYDYDPKTFRLRQLRTTRLATGALNPEFPQFASNLADDRVLQQLHFTYDPSGNVTEIYDEAYEPVFFQNQVVEPHSRYEYDALYRLVCASGRENGALRGAPTIPESASLDLGFPIGDPSAQRNYTQTFLYDPVGNIERVHHEAGIGTWTRRFHEKSPLDAPPGRAGRKKACCQRQHQSCKVGAWQFGVPATVSTTPAIIWCGLPSTASGCCKERYGSAYENYFWR